MPIIRFGRKKVLYLGWMDIDYAIRKKEPSAITEANTSDAADLYEKVGEV